MENFEEQYKQAKSNFLQEYHKYCKEYYLKRKTVNNLEFNWLKSKAFEAFLNAKKAQQELQKNKQAL